MAAKEGGLGGAAADAAPPPVPAFEAMPYANAVPAHGETMWSGRPRPSATVDALVAVASRVGEAPLVATVLPYLLAKAGPLASKVRASAAAEPALVEVLHALWGLLPLISAKATVRTVLGRGPTGGSLQQLLTVLPQPDGPRPPDAAKGERVGVGPSGCGGVPRWGPWANGEVHLTLAAVLASACRVAGPRPVAKHVLPALDGFFRRFTTTYADCAVGSAEMQTALEIAAKLCVRATADALVFACLRTCFQVTYRPLHCCFPASSHPAGTCRLQTSWAVAR